MAVAGTRRALQKHSWRFGQARAYVTVGAPIPTDGLTTSDVPALKARTRAAIEALRAQLAPLVDGAVAAGAPDAGAAAGLL